MKRERGKEREWEIWREREGKRERTDNKKHGQRRDAQLV
jgi:hypothetical protein